MILKRLGNKARLIDKNHIVKKENLTNIGFFNIESPEIHTPIKSWDEIANRILEENKELWERLAKL